MKPELLHRLRAAPAIAVPGDERKEFVRDYIDAAPDAWQFLGADQAVQIAGMKKVPNKYRGYLDFRLGYAFPVISTYRTSIHSGTLSNSWESMVDQNFNYGHQIARYYKGTDQESRYQDDRIIGAIVGVEFAGQDPRHYRLGQDKEAPGLRCVAALFKQARGMDRIIGSHLSGREWTVSMEIDYRLEDSGVALIPRAGEEAQFPEAEAALVAQHTTDEFKRCQFGYLPLLAAPDDLIECFSEKKGIWDTPWHGHDVVTMLGGLNGHIHFKGAGLVQYGAEPTATIDQMLAGKTPAPLLDAAARYQDSLARLAAAFS